MRLAILFSLLALSACKESLAPFAGDRYVLRKVDGVALPASQPGFTSQVLSDTLVFGAESSQWRPRPLARAIRQVRYSNGQVGADEWWYTYDASAGTPFPFRGLCADGDLAGSASASASCIDASGTATIEGNQLIIRFRVLGTLTYERLTS